MLVVQFGGQYDVTPDDDADLPQAAVALYVGGEGDVAVADFQNHTAVFKDVPVGTWLYGQFRRVLDTGTDATNIVAVTSPGTTVT
jgi:hypothetical protein